MGESSGKKRESAMSRANKSGGLNRFYVFFGAVAIVGASILIYGVASKAQGTVAAEPVELEGTDDLRRLVEMAVGVTMGEEDAPVTVIEFGDYMCTHCGVFTLQIRPMLEMQYVETGKAKFIHYDFPLSQNPHSFVAARAARCAQDQGDYWSYQKLLYRNQAQWAFAQSTPIDTFLEYAGLLGMDERVFESCLRSDRHAEVVTANLLLGQALGVDGTPTVMAGQESMARRLRDYSYETIAEAIETLLTLPTEGT